MIGNEQFNPNNSQIIQAGNFNGAGLSRQSIEIKKKQVEMHEKIKKMINRTISISFQEPTRRSVDAQYNLVEFTKHFTSFDQFGEYEISDLVSIAKNVLEYETMKLNLGAIDIEGPIPIEDMKAYKDVSSSIRIFLYNLQRSSAFISRKALEDVSTLLNNLITVCLKTSKTLPSDVELIKLWLERLRIPENQEYSPKELENTYSECLLLNSLSSLHMGTGETSEAGKMASQSIEVSSSWIKRNMGKFEQPRTDVKKLAFSRRFNRILHLLLIAMVHKAYIVASRGPGKAKRALGLLKKAKSLVAKFEYSGQGISNKINSMIKKVKKIAQVNDRKRRNRTNDSFGLRAPKSGFEASNSRSRSRRSKRSRAQQFAKSQSPSFRLRSGRGIKSQKKAKVRNSQANRRKHNSNDIRIRSGSFMRNSKGNRNNFLTNEEKVDTTDFEVGELTLGKGPGSNRIQSPVHHQRGPKDSHGTKNQRNLQEGNKQNSKHGYGYEESFRGHRKSNGDTRHRKSSQSPNFRIKKKGKIHSRKKSQGHHPHKRKYKKRRPKTGGHNHQDFIVKTKHSDQKNHIFDPSLTSSNGNQGAPYAHRSKPETVITHISNNHNIFPPSRLPPGPPNSGNIFQAPYPPYYHPGGSTTTTHYYPVPYIYHAQVPTIHYTLDQQKQNSKKKSSKKSGGRSKGNRGSSQGTYPGATPHPHPHDLIPLNLVKDKAESEKYRGGLVPKTKVKKHATEGFKEKKEIRNQNSLNLDDYEGSSYNPEQGGGGGQNNANYQREFEELKMMSRTIQDEIKKMNMSKEPQTNILDKMASSNGDDGLQLPEDPNQPDPEFFASSDRKGVSNTPDPNHVVNTGQKRHHNLSCGIDGGQQVQESNLPKPSPPSKNSHSKGFVASQEGVELSPLPGFNKGVVGRSGVSGFHVANQNQVKAGLNDQKDSQNQNLGRQKDGLEVDGYGKVELTSSHNLEDISPISHPWNDYNDGVKEIEDLIELNDKKFEIEDKAKHTHQGNLNKQSEVTGHQTRANQQENPQKARNAQNHPEQPNRADGCENQINGRGSGEEDQKKTNSPNITSIKPNPAIKGKKFQSSDLSNNKKPQMANTASPPNKIEGGYSQNQKGSGSGNSSSPHQYQMSLQLRSSSNGGGGGATNSPSGFNSIRKMAKKKQTIGSLLSNPNSDSMNSDKKMVLKTIGQLVGKIIKPRSSFCVMNLAKKKDESSKLAMFLENQIDEAQLQMSRRLVIADGNQRRENSEIKEEESQKSLGTNSSSSRLPVGRAQPQRNAKNSKASSPSSNNSLAKNSKNSEEGGSNSSEKGKFFGGKILAKQFLALPGLPFSKNQASFASNNSFISRISNSSRLATSGPMSSFMMSYFVYLKYALHNIKKEGSRYKEYLRKIVLGSSESFCFEFFIFVDKTGESGRKEVNLQIVVSLYDAEKKESSDLVWRELLREEQIKYIFQNLNIYDVMPTCFPISTMKDLVYFINFVLIHYMRLNYYENVEPENYVMINSEIVGLVEKEVTFLKIPCMLYFIHCNSNIFRIVIKREDIPEDQFDESIGTFRLDFEFNHIAMKKYVLQPEINESCNIIREVIEQLEKGEKVDNSTFEKLNKHQNYGYTGFAIKEDRLEEVEEIIDLLVGHFEEFLNFFEEGFEEASGIDQYFMAKILDLKERKFVINQVFESEGCDCFRIRARNCFESYSSNKAGEMVKAIGKFEPRVVEIKKIFGLDYHKLKWGEKRFLWQVYVQRTELTYFEKQPNLLLLETHQDPDEMFMKTLKIRNVQFPIAMRFYIKKKYVIPFNFQMIALDTEILGIRIQMFDVQKVRQSSAFFVLFNTYRFVDPNQVVKKKKSKKAIKLKEFSKMHGIVDLLKNHGFGYLKHPGRLTVVRRGDLMIKRNAISSSYSSCFNGLDYFYDPSSQGLFE